MTLGSGELQEAYRKAVPTAADLIDCCRGLDGPIGGQYVLIGYRLPIDHDSLVESHQMRRCVQTGSAATSVQDRGQGGGHGTLAIGSSHVNGIEVFLGIAQTGQYATDGVEAELDTEAPQRVHFIQAGLIRFAHGRDDKKPGGIFPRRARNKWPGSLTAIPIFSRSGQSFSSQGFPRFSTAELTRFFIALFELEPFEETVILNLLLQDSHGLFNVIVDNPDFNILQIPRPLLYFNFMAKFLESSFFISISLNIILYIL